VSENELDHDEEVARADGNYLAMHYIREVRARRAADLTDAEREALRFAAMVVSASEFLFADRMTDPKIAAHVGRCRAALSALARVLGGGE
jgi:hypothetical protein